MEMAALALGVILVAIEALRGYRAALPSVWNVKCNLSALIRDLETEKIIPQSTCEALLGVVPPSQIDSIIEDPFGPVWKRYDD